MVVPLRPGADLDLVRAKLSGAFAQHDHPVVWHIPRERGDIVQLADHAAEAARDNAGLLVAAGGDGTINAVAAAALRAGVPMGVVPMGTFNYFSREQGLELDAAAAVLQLLEALRIGEALVSFLDENGMPSVVERAYILPPSSQLPPLDARERDQAYQGDVLYRYYKDMVENYSAFEALSEQAVAEQAQAEQAKAEAQTAKTDNAQSVQADKTAGSSALEGFLGGLTGGRKKTGQGTAYNVADALGSQINKQATKAISRGLMGVIKNLLK